GSPDWRNARCALADPPDRAVLALYPCDIFRADHPAAVRPRRTVLHRGPHRTRVHAPMNSVLALDRCLARYPSAAVAGYVGLVLALVAATWLAVVDIFERREAVRAASDLAAQLEGRPRPRQAIESAAAAPAPTGSPFLEGETITVAGAALLQRIA